MEAKNPRDNALREVVADFIAAKAQALDEAALLTLYPRERAAGEIRRHVNQILSEPER